jgi:hypothetical protein
MATIPGMGLGLGDLLGQQTTQETEEERRRRLQQQQQQQANGLSPSLSSAFGLTRATPGVFGGAY